MDSKNLFEIIQEYLFYLKNVKSLNDNSILVYKTVLRHLSVLDFSEQYLLSLKNSLENQYKEGYVKYIFTIIKSFGKWCFKNKYTMQQFPDITIKTKEVIKPFLKDEQVLKLLELLPQKYELYVRLMLFGGLRISEALSLKKENIDFQDDCVILNILGKRSKVRQMPIFDKKTIELLKNYDYKLRINPKSINYCLKNIGKKMKLPYNLHPHILRHSFASHLYQKGLALDIIQKLLGHKNISTTMIYAKISTNAVKDRLKSIQ